MTERSRQARWTTVAVLAPITAAMLAGSTAWAAEHDPLAEQKAEAARVEQQREQALAEQQRQHDEAVATQIAAETAEVARLREEVTTLTAQVADVQARADSQPAAAPAASRPAAGAVSSGSQRSSGSGSRSSSTKKSSAPAKAPAPATHAKTGGS
ncbi:MAG: hypothetical protein ACK5MT_02395 [Actinomycetales bacterium]